MKLIEAVIIWISTLAFRKTIYGNTGPHALERLGLKSVLVLNVLVWKSFSFSFIRNLSRRLLLSPLFNRYYRLSFISILLKYSAYRLSSPSRFHQIRTFILSFLSSFSFFLLLYFSSFLSSRLSHILPLFIYCLFLFIFSFALSAFQYFSFLIPF